MIAAAAAGSAAGPSRRVALTGATGFLGSHLADQLLLRGHRVRCSVRPTSNRRWLRHKSLEIVTVDLLDPADVARLVAGTDWIVHCAGVTSAPTEADYRRSNFETTRVLLEAAAEGKDASAFLFVSSLAAAGPAPLTDPQTEERSCRPISAYGRSKLAAEELLTASAWPFRTLALRPPALYGPRDREFLPLLKLARHGWTVRIGSRLAGLSLVHGVDAAAAAVALLESDRAGGAYFVDDGAPTPQAAGPIAPAPRLYRWGYDFTELKAALEQVMRRSVRAIRVPVAPLRWCSRLIGTRRAARFPLLAPDRLADFDAAGWVCSGERLRRDTAFRPQFDLVRGLQDTVDFYRGHRWLT